VINNDSRSKNHPQNRRDYEKKISVSTVNNYLRNIKAFINWCVAEKLLKDNVAKTVKHLKASRKPKEQLSNQEYKRLIGSLDTTKYVEFRDYTIINIIMDSGMRIGETLALQIKDVDLVRRAVMINADNAKSKRDRVVFFSRKTGQLLRRWIQYKDRYFETDILFPTNRCSQLKVMNFEKNFRKYVALCGIKKYVTPHSLRNNFGRRFLVNGGDIFTLSKILGHSSVTVTEQAYADLSDEDVRRNYQRFSSIENMDK
jgi:integrase/recombinase XerD